MNKMNLIDVPNEWPAKLKYLGDFEDLLRCPICSEYMDTAMLVTKCSHTYCSLCIRRSFTYKTQCPTCFVGASEGELVNNRVVDDLIAKFSTVRLTLLEFLKESQSSEPSQTNKKLPAQNSSVKDTNNGVGGQPKLTSKFAQLTAVHRTKHVSDNSFIKLTTKTKSESQSAARANDAKSITNSKQQYGLRKKGVKKKYTQCDSNGTTTDGSENDVVLCDEDTDMSDDDFLPISPDIRPSQKSIKAKKKPRFSPLRKSPACNKPDLLAGGLLSSPKQSLPSQVQVESTDSVSNIRSLTKSFSDDSEAELRDYTVADPKEGSEGVQPLRLPQVMGLRMPSMSPSSMASPPSVYQSSQTGSNKGGPAVPVVGPSAASSGQAKQATVRVPCPVCGVEIPERHVNLHLDRCLARKDQPEKRGVSPRKKLMPKLVYNLLSDKELRKKCSEVGISTLGDRKMLIKRHHELTLLHNSKCDSGVPVSMANLLKEVERKERACSKRPMVAATSSAGKLFLQKGASVEQVEVAQKQYVKQHKSQFDQLIADARKRRLEKQKRKPEETQSSEVADKVSNSPVVDTTLHNTIPTSELQAHGQLSPERDQENDFICPNIETPKSANTGQTSQSKKEALVQSPPVNVSTHLATHILTSDGADNSASASDQTTLIDHRVQTVTSIEPGDDQPMSSSCLGGQEGTVVPQPVASGERIKIPVSEATAVNAPNVVSKETKTEDQTGGQGVNKVPLDLEHNDENFDAGSQGVAKQSPARKQRKKTSKKRKRPQEDSLIKEGESSPRLTQTCVANNAMPANTVPNSGPLKLDITNEDSLPGKKSLEKQKRKPEETQSSEVADKVSNSPVVDTTLHNTIPTSELQVHGQLSPGRDQERGVNKVPLDLEHNDENFGAGSQGVAKQSPARKQRKKTSKKRKRPQEDSLIKEGESSPRLTQTCVANNAMPANTVPNSGPLKLDITTEDSLPGKKRRKKTTRRGARDTRISTDNKLNASLPLPEFSEEDCDFSREGKEYASSSQKSASQKKKNGLFREPEPTTGDDPPKPELTPEDTVVPSSPEAMYKSGRPRYGQPPSLTLGVYSPSVSHVSDSLPTSPPVSPMSEEFLSASQPRRSQRPRCKRKLNTDGQELAQKKEKKKKKKKNVKEADTPS